MEEYRYFIYILSNKSRTVFYTGVTNDLTKRVYEHRNNLTKGFTSKYNVKDLLYYEIFRDINLAILREKQIKRGSRKKKLELIQSMNKDMKDLYLKCKKLGVYK